MSADLSPLANSLTALITAAATLGGVALAARSSRLSAERQLEADERREDARLAREDAEKLEASDAAKSAAAIATYRAVANHFVGELSTVRTWDGAVSLGDDAGFEEWYGQQWSTQGQMRLIRAIADVENDAHRVQLDRVVEAVTLFPNIANLTYKQRTWLVERTVKIGFDLASAWARGQEADAELIARYDDMMSDVELVHDYYEDLREARREAAKPKRSGQSRAKSQPSDQPHTTDSGGAGR